MRELYIMDLNWLSMSLMYMDFPIGSEIGLKYLFTGWPCYCQCDGLSYPFLAVYLSIVLMVALFLAFTTRDYCFEPREYIWNFWGYAFYTEVPGFRRTFSDILYLFLRKELSTAMDVGMQTMWKSCIHVWLLLIFFSILLSSSSYPMVRGVLFLGKSIGWAVRQFVLQWVIFCKFPLCS